MTITYARPGRLISLLMVLLVAAVVALVHARPAAAAVSAGLPTVCPNGSLICLWPGTYRRGTVVFYRASNLKHGARLAPSIAGKASSMWIAGNRSITVWATPDCRGSALVRETFAPGYFQARLARIGWDNLIHSVQLTEDIGRGC